MSDKFRTIRNVSLIIGFWSIVGGLLSPLISTDIYYEVFIFGVCSCILGIAMGSMVQQQKPPAGDQKSGRIAPESQSQLQAHTEPFVKPIASPTPQTVLNQPKTLEPEPNPIHATIDNTILITTEKELEEFSSDHLFIEELFTKVVGVTYLNDDGSNRQEILSRCTSGEPVIFHPYKFEGAPAIAVFTQHGQIGHLSAKLAEQLECGYGFDVVLSGTIKDVTGGQDGLHFGCNLLIQVYRASIQDSESLNSTRKTGDEMYCKNCGKQIHDDVSFCPYCGTGTKPIASTPTLPVRKAPPSNATPPYQPLAQPVFYQYPAKKDSIFSKWWFWVIAVFVVFMLVPSSEEEPPQMSEQEYKAMCTQIEFENLSRNPDKYKGEYFTFTGEVIQVVEEWDEVSLRINITPVLSSKGEVIRYKDTIYATVVIPESEDRILEDDIIMIYGQCGGLYSYRSILGSQVSLPIIEIEYYELVSQN